MALGISGPDDPIDWESLAKYATEVMGRAYAPYSNFKVGVAGLVVGGVLGGLAIGKNNEAAAFCRPDEPTLCSAQGVALGQDVKALGTASTVAIVAGSVLAAGGVVLFLVAPGGRAAEGAAPAAPAEKKGSSERGGVRALRARVTAGWIGVEGSW